MQICDSEISSNSSNCTLSSDWEITEDAFAGVAIGIADHGQIRIEDALTEGQNLQFMEFPNFASGLLNSVRAGDSMKAKDHYNAPLHFVEEGLQNL